MMVGGRREGQKVTGALESVPLTRGVCGTTE